MKKNKQNPDFLYLGRKLLDWYEIHGRELPFRKTKDPYHIWICEIIFQQTRIEQGLNHYNRFTARFPDVQTLADAATDEVLLYWKGLGYYSRALNIHRAASQIVGDFNGVFPRAYDDILSLPGVGRYTAAAVSSICFGRDLPAVDGNFYRVLSRVFADDFDISKSTSFLYFSELALRILPPGEGGTFNEAMMDLGSEICRPRNPRCGECPLNKYCMALHLGKTMEFPVKTKKQKTTDLELTYYFVQFENRFLIRQRKEDFIWKKLYEFPDAVDPEFEPFIVHRKFVSHKLTHKNMTVHFCKVILDNAETFERFASVNGYTMTTLGDANLKSFPKPLQSYFESQFL